MKLSEILKGLSYTCGNFIDCEINDIAYDSRKCGEGILFVCTIIPAIVYTLVFILFKIYPLKKDKLEVMYEDLKKSREVTAS